MRFYLWGISKPGKNGTPHFDLSEDPQLQLDGKTNLQANFVRESNNEDF